MFDRNDFFRLLTVLALTIVAAGAAWAQVDEPKVGPLTWSDRNDLERKREMVDQLGRLNFGIPVRDNKTDLKLLQRIADEKLISIEKKAELQALGAVLGNLLQQELGLQWQVYEDHLGRNRALCVADTAHCLFPLTMLSRRLEVGLSVNVQEVYDQAVAAILPYIPDNNGFDGLNKPPAPKWEPPSGPIKKIRVL